jgi:hypothetical protein
MMSKLVKVSKVPALKVAPDAEVAEHLRTLVRDAEAGLKRILMCGMYIEWIAASLPHGQLMPWIAEHCPDISQRTVYNWRTLARSVCDWAGIKFATIANLDLSADKLISLPVEELPSKALPWRKKIDSLLAANDTAKQLFFDLKMKQGELDMDGETFRPKIGRAKGEGGASKQQRLSAKEARLQLEMESLELWAQATTAKLDDVADFKQLGMIGDETLARLVEAMEHAAAIGRKVITLRAGKSQPDH